jgi:hypothetical protein
MTLEPETIKGQSKPGYSLLGDQLISHHVLETIQGELMGVKKHDDALRIFEKYDIKACSLALSLRGYRVK